MKLSLHPETERLIAEKISSGRYRSADEVVREGLELLEERDKAIPSASANKVSDIVELFQRIASTVPDSEWEKLPRDLSINLDHYLYGAKKTS